MLFYFFWASWIRKQFIQNSLLQIIMCWLSYPIKHPCALSQAMIYLQLKWKFLSRICIFAGLIKHWPQKPASPNLNLLTVPKQTSQEQEKTIPTDFKVAHLAHKRRILGRKQERNITDICWTHAKYQTFHTCYLMSPSHHTMKEYCNCLHKWRNGGMGRRHHPRLCQEVASESRLFLSTKLSCKASMSGSGPTGCMWPASIVAAQTI